MHPATCRGRLLLLAVTEHRCAAVWGALLLLTAATAAATPVHSCGSRGGQRGKGTPPAPGPHAQPAAASTHQAWLPLAKQQTLRQGFRPQGPLSRWPPRFLNKLEHHPCLRPAPPPGVSHSSRKSNRARSVPRIFSASRSARCARLMSASDTCQGVGVEGGRWVRVG